LVKIINLKDSARKLSFQYLHRFFEWCFKRSPNSKKS